MLPRRCACVGLVTLVLSLLAGCPREPVVAPNPEASSAAESAVPPVAPGAAPYVPAGTVQIPPDNLTPPGTTPDPNTPTDPNMVADPNAIVDPNSGGDPPVPQFNPDDWVGAWVGTMSGADVMTRNGEPNGVVDRSDGLSITIDSFGQVTSFRFYPPSSWQPTWWWFTPYTPIHAATGDYRAWYQPSHYAWMGENGTLTVTERAADHVSFTSSGTTWGTTNYLHRKLNGTARRKFILTLEDGDVRCTALARFEYELADEYPYGVWTYNQVLEDYSATALLKRGE